MDRSEDTYDEDLRRALRESAETPVPALPLDEQLALAKKASLNHGPPKTAGLGHFPFDYTVDVVNFLDKYEEHYKTMEQEPAFLATVNDLFRSDVSDRPRDWGIRY